jgi:hypothetical protein
LNIAVHSLYDYILVWLYKKRRDTLNETYECLKNSLFLIKKSNTNKSNSSSSSKHSHFFALCKTYFWTATVLYRKRISSKRWYRYRRYRYRYYHHDLMSYMLWWQDFFGSFSERTRYLKNLKSRLRNWSFKANKLTLIFPSHI